MSLTDKDILDLSRQVSYDQLNDLGVELGLPLTDICNLKEQYRYDTREIALKMMNQWKTKDSSGLVTKDKLESVIEATKSSPASASNTKDLKKMITPKLSADECRGRLVDHYKRTVKIPLKPWDRSNYTDFQDLHTKISLLVKDRGRRGGLETKRVPLPGSINDIFRKKVDGALPTRILLIGGAGHGKTTSVAKMALDWATKDVDSPLKDVPLLFALKYRRTGKSTSLGEAIVRQLLGHMKGVTPEEMEQFIDNNEEDCFILLDGYDEFSGSMSSPDPKSSLVELTLNQRFLTCRVLVTSRPDCKEDFEVEDLSYVYAVMELEGFSTEKSDEYIDRFFRSNPQTSQHLKNYIEEDTDIRCLVSTPFFCMAICTLWQGGLLNLVHSQPSLLDNLLMYLVQHARSKVPLSGRSLAGMRSAEEIKTFICSIGKVAYQSFVSDSDRAVFTLEDFEECKKALDLAIRIGLVSKDTDSEDPVSWFEIEPLPTLIHIEFYHKLAQDHCAGIYLASLSKTEFKRKLCNLQGISKRLEMLNLLTFASGSCKEACRTNFAEMLPYFDLYPCSMIAFNYALQTIRNSSLS